MNDIDLSSYSNWDPIGDNSSGFTGSLDGNGYVIQNLTINRPLEDNVGLFTQASGEIKNLGFENVDISGKNAVGALAAGGSNISNCYVKGIVECETSGGLLLGLAAGDITNCYSTGQVTGVTGQAFYAGAGGLIGSAFGANINSCFSDSQVMYTGIADSTGGLVGLAYDSVITNCYTKGTVTGSNSVGGIAGGITSPSSQGVGSSISNSFSTATITGAGTNGAIAGVMGQTSSIVNSTWDITTGQSVAVGYNEGGTERNNKGLTTAEMQDPSNWSGWDTSIWDFSTYPPTFKMYTPVDAPTDPSQPGGDTDQPDENSTITGSVNANDEPDTPFAGQTDGEIIFSDGTTVDVSKDDSRTDVLDKINDAGLNATIDSNGHIVITKPDGSEIFIESDSSGFSDHYGLPTQGSNPNRPGISDEPIPGAVRLQIGSDSSSTSAIYVDTSFDLGAFDVDFSSADSCAAAIEDIDEVLSRINTKRSEFGAVINRLSSILESQTTTIQNFTSAQSTIMDADIANESADFVKNQILQQTSSALLAQSQNLHASIVLSLIG